MKKLFLIFMLCISFVPNAYAIAPSKQGIFDAINDDRELYRGDNGAAQLEMSADLDALAKQIVSPTIEYCFTWNSFENHYNCFERIYMLNSIANVFGMGVSYSIRDACYPERTSASFVSNYNTDLVTSEGSPNIASAWDENYTQIGFYFFYEVQCSEIVFMLLK